ncbi:FAD-dependent oxidoreductase [Caballeronia sp. EK]|uniref:FAD-dependent oxidoreductase n=1 Tax=Caballeronia sp. EK TaxID=2767469 RepID=UPI0016557B67|nr:FAD-dependent oxidoreductase [Caballeronia sp. EK]MBC8639777.1 FAD-dependent oxidoreductase [Caballeronia sp. EK]
MSDTNKLPAASRRNFIKAASAGTAAAAFGAVSLTARAASETRFDAEYDVVVCGGGGGGLPCALFSRWLGNRVVILEKAGSVGGTAAKAAFWYWVPNNEPMRRAGIADPKADYMRYVARLSRPEQYDPSLPKLGLSDWEYEMCEAIYDSASPAAELLASKGALPYRHEAAVPDYWAELPEDKAPRGRVLFPKDGLPSMSDGGRVAIRTMSAAARRDGIDIKTGYRVQKVLVDESGAVIGVESLTEEGELFRVRAKKAVVFATGGFTHDPELRKNFLHGAVYGGCAAPTNEGDFVRISSALDVQLRNMNYSWMAPISLDKAIAKDGSLSGIFTPTGDSMLYVNKYGKRVVNEKLAYNEVCATFSEWDGAKGEYPNLTLISIWDQQAQDHCASDDYGSLIVPKGSNDRHVLRGNTLAELAGAIRERMAKYRSALGNADLSDDFVRNLDATIKRFNGFAKTGVDQDFHRGERIVEKLFNGTVSKKADQKNETMYPLSAKGPYYAALIVAGNLDTKGGPKTNSHGQVLDTRGEPIKGLYGVGNCVASASARAYWAGGGTLGPILAFAYRAAQSASGVQS